MRERGSGRTPQPLVDLLEKAVAEKGLIGVEKATGVGKSAIGRYVKGIGEPTTATLEKFADYFKVNVAWLRGETWINRDGTVNLAAIKREDGELDWGKVALNVLPKDKPPTVRCARCGNQLKVNDDWSEAEDIKVWPCTKCCELRLEKGSDGEWFW